MTAALFAITASGPGRPRRSTAARGARLGDRALAAGVAGGFAMIKFAAARTSSPRPSRPATASREAEPASANRALAELERLRGVGAGDEVRARGDDVVLRRAGSRSGRAARASRSAGSPAGRPAGRRRSRSRPASTAFSTSGPRSKVPIFTPVPASPLAAASPPSELVASTPSAPSASTARGDQRRRARVVVDDRRARARARRPRASPSRARAQRASTPVLSTCWLRQSARRTPASASRRPGLEPGAVLDLADVGEHAEALEDVAAGVDRDDRDAGLHGAPDRGRQAVGSGSRPRARRAWSRPPGRSARSSARR